MMHYILPVFLLAICIFAALVMYRTVYTIPPSGWLVVDEMGIVERDLRNLKEVIVICNSIEKPFNLLLDAVVNNFSERVVYRFFVSAENVSSCREVFLPFFKSLIEVAAGLQGSSIEAHAELVHVHSLPFKRTSGYPFIFYCYEGIDPKQGGHNMSGINIIGFRGCDEGRGIAEKYRRIDKGEAHSLLATTLGTLIGQNDRHLPGWVSHIGIEKFTEEETTELVTVKTPGIFHKTELQVLTGGKL